RSATQTQQSWQCCLPHSESDSRMPIVVGACVSFGVLDRVDRASGRAWQHARHIGAWQVGDNMFTADSMAPYSKGALRASGALRRLPYADLLATRRSV